MIAMCKKCKRSALCTELCEEAENLVPKALDYKIQEDKRKMKRGRERTGVDLSRRKKKKKRGNYDYDVVDTGVAEDDEESDPITEIEETSVAEGDEESDPITAEGALWAQMSQSVPTPLDEKEYGLLRNYIDKAVPGRKTTIKNRFLAFMRCKNMTDIARRANVTKQNVQKQFASIISRMSKFEFLTDRFDEIRKGKLTPKQMKERFIVEKWYAY